MTDAEPRRHLLIVVVLPDRPGALGAVASRIGALATDITDIHFGTRDHGNVETTFHLDLPPGEGDGLTQRGIDFVELLIGEMCEVDGVIVRSQRTASCCPRR